MADRTGAWQGQSGSPARAASRLTRPLTRQSTPIRRLCPIRPPQSIFASTAMCRRQAQHSSRSTAPSPPPRRTISCWRRQITSDQLGTPIFLRNLLLNQNGRGNTLTIRCQRSVGSVTLLSGLYRHAPPHAFAAQTSRSPAPGRRRRLRTAAVYRLYLLAVWDYIVTVPAAAQTLSVCADVYACGRLLPRRREHRLSCLAGRAAN